MFSTPLTITYKPSMINKSMVCTFCYTFDNMGTFHILNDVIFVRSYIYQLKSPMRKNVFLYSKTGPAPVWLESKNYSSTFHLVALSEEIDCSRKYEEQKNAYWTPKIHNIRKRRMRVSRSLLKWQNKVMRIYLLLVLRPQKSRGGIYAKHKRVNKIN